MSKSTEELVSAGRRRFLKRSMIALGGTSAGLVLVKHAREKLRLRWADDQRVGPGGTVELTIDGDRKLSGETVTVELFRIHNHRRTRIKRVKGVLVDGRLALSCKLDYPYDQLVPGTYRYRARVRIGRFLPQWTQSKPLEYEVVPFWFSS